MQISIQNLTYPYNKHTVARIHAWQLKCIARLNLDLLLLFVDATHNVDRQEILESNRWPQMDIVAGTGHGVSRCLLEVHLFHYSYAFDNERRLALFVIFTRTLKHFSNRQTRLQILPDVRRRGDEIAGYREKQLVRRSVDGFQWYI